MVVNKYWNNILNNKVEFIKFLRDEFNVNWVEKNLIMKQPNQIMTAFSENNNLSFSVNSEDNKAMLKLDTCGQIKEFVLLIENNELRIYKKSEYALNRFIIFIKERIDPCSISKDQWRRIIWAIHEQNNTLLEINLRDRSGGIFDEPAIHSGIKS